LNAALIRQDLMADRYKLFSSAMSSSKSTYTSVVLGIILVFSLLNTPVSIGKPLLESQEEEESQNFQITYRGQSDLMEEYDMFNMYI